MNNDVEDDVDFVAIVTEELAADPTLPDSLKAAILERAKMMRVRRRVDVGAPRPEGA